MRKNCTVEGCDRLAKAKGLCPTHYMAAWREPRKKEAPLQLYGPRAGKGKVLAWILEHNTWGQGEEGLGPCLEWPFGKPDGDMVMSHNGATMSPARYILWKKHGAPKTPSKALQICGNRRCVAHKHLRWVPNGDYRGALAEIDTQHIRLSLNALGWAELCDRLAVYSAEEVFKQILGEQKERRIKRQNARNEVRYKRMDKREGGSK